MSKKKPWDEDWKLPKQKQIGSGGQGLIFLVEPKNDLFPPGKYILKKLKNQESLERRSRMHIEVTAIERLNVLDCPNIPKLIDSNSQYFRDKDFPLYMVIEFIEGSTLYDFISKGIMDVFDAINLTLNLLKTLEFCHEKDIVHRDIKPTNIIVKDNNIDTPFLIDFGLSFNKEDDINVTPIGQDVGNRFLFLPEHRRESGLQRDPRSDITQICGILFFLITGKEPIYLYDEERNKPHQTEKAQEKLSKLPEHILLRINMVFDTAFIEMISSRWQSIPALRNALTDILESENQQSNENFLIDRIKHKASSNIKDGLFINVAHKFLDKVYDIVYDLFEELYSVIPEDNPKLGLLILGDKARTKQPEIDWKNLTFSNSGLGITYKDKQFSPGFEGYLTGNEVVLVYVKHYIPKSELHRQRSFSKMVAGEDSYVHEYLDKYENSKTPLLRTSLKEPNFTTLKENVRRLYIKGIDDIMN
ncbi:protein kinase [Okeania sp. SIO2B3]|uniref:protein kinase domain-containing protein n=1 Tax=Okeania sp. SIO2B3 TaxID=2607784 RepID=UPI0013BF6B59|nr:protein kinase [Okeania sp. SIO2B3]NET43856.1 protein kinase [Okeania sp. SIO2B3]